MVKITLNRFLTTADSKKGSLFNTTNWTLRIPCRDSRVLNSAWSFVRRILLWVRQRFSPAIASYFRSKIKVLLTKPRRFADLFNDHSSTCKDFHIADLKDISRSDRRNARSRKSTMWSSFNFNFDIGDHPDDLIDGLCTQIGMFLLRTGLATSPEQIQSLGLFDDWNFDVTGNPKHDEHNLLANKTS